MNGRPIIDSVQVMHELVRGYDEVGSKPRSVLRIDMVKTCDTLCWDYLFTIIKVLGFPSQFMQWIIAWVSNAHSLHRF